MLIPSNNPRPQICNNSENSNPNIPSLLSSPKLIKSPAIKSSRAKELAAEKSSRGGGNCFDFKASEEEKFFRGDGMDAGQKEKKTSLEVNKMRSLVMEEAMRSMPELGAGRVMHLVKAFERFLSIAGEAEAEKGKERNERVRNWALPGFYQAAKNSENEANLPNLPSDFATAEFSASKDFGTDVESNADRSRFPPQMMVLLS